jgi:hypothetical protein
VGPAVVTVQGGGIVSVVVRASYVRLGF